MKEEQAEYSVQANPEHRRVSDHEKEETQKEIAKHLKSISRNTFWTSIYIGLGILIYVLFK